MSNDGAPHVLLLRDPRAAATADWQQLEQRPPAARPGPARARPRPAGGGGGAGAGPPRCLEGARYDLIVTDAVLPDGGPYGLLGTLIARQYETTVVVHFRLEGCQRWLVLFAEGEFDL